MGKKIAIVLLALSPLMVVPACGGDDDDDVVDTPSPSTVPDDLFVVESGNPHTSGWFVTIGPSGTRYECLRPQNYNPSPMNCFPMLQTLD